MWNIIIGIVFIVGGASGGLALKGTGSSGALVVVGVGLVIWGGIQLSQQGKAKETTQRRPARKPLPIRRATKEQESVPVEQKA